MSFDSWQAFFAMGGHAPYVWTAYGLAVLVLVFNVAIAWRAHRRFFDEQWQRQRRMARHAAAATDAATPNGERL
jgi:heme exporter protein D